MRGLKRTRFGGRSDGVGILAGRLAETDGDHLGLRLRAELVDQASGKLDVRGAPGGGTIVAVEVPSP